MMSTSSFRDDLLDFTDGNEIADKRVKPALLALLDDQAELLDASDSAEEGDLRNGFHDRRGLIEWYQRAIVRTLGHIAEKWEPKDCITDGVLIASTVDGVEMEGVPAKWYRRMLESVAVQPAFNRAYKDMEKVAKSYVQRPDEDRSVPSGKDLDPSKQAYLAMRPGFQVLDAQQHRALTDLWGGFESVDDVQDWLHALNAPTNGEIGTDASESFISDGVSLERLVYDREAERSRIYREAVAAVVILPKFIDGVRSMKTEELAKETSGTPTTMRMKGGH